MPVRYVDLARYQAFQGAFEVAAISFTVRGDRTIIFRAKDWLTIATGDVLVVS